MISGSDGDAPLELYFRDDCVLGTGRRRIALDPDIKGRLIGRLLARHEEVKYLRRVTDLSPVDHLNLYLAEAVSSRLERGTYTAQDLAFAWYTIHDEITQIEMCTGSLPKDVPGRRPKWTRIPFLRQLQPPPRTEIEEVQIPDQQRELLGSVGTLFRNYSKPAIVNELRSLNNLRLEIEQSFFSKGFHDPRFDTRETSVHPLRFQRGSALTLHNRISAAVNNEVLQAWYQRSFAELWYLDNGPAATIFAFWEANHRALTNWNLRMSEGALMAEKPQADVPFIRTKASRIASAIARDGGGQGDNSDQARALNLWCEAVEHYEKLVQTYFSAGYESDYSFEQLASAHRRQDGSMLGAERLRELILGVPDHFLHYDPILARKMLPDETIALAIIRTHRLDVVSSLSPERVNFSNITDRLKNTVGQTRLTLGRQLLVATLPYLRSSQFQIAFLVRLLIQEGARAAENPSGYPYVRLI